MFVLLLTLCVSIRIFTGAPEAQVNFAQLIFNEPVQQQLTTPTYSHDVATVKPILFEKKSAVPRSPDPSEHKMYKKYLPPETTVSIFENYLYHAERVFVSIAATSIYIKDLTLKSLNSNSPPAPITPALFTLLLILLIIRIGVFGNNGEFRNNGDRRFSLQ